jgi:hypothetical protein
MTFMPSDYGDLASALSGYGKKSNPYDTRRKFAYGLVQQGTDTSPIQSPWQGAARLAQALAGSYGIYKADADEKEAGSKLAEQLAQIGNIKDPVERMNAYTKLDPETGMRYGAQLAIEQYKQNAGREANKEAGGIIAANYGMPGATGMPTQLGANASAIAGIESAGQPNNGYGAIGPPADAKGSRAIGKFQVMDYNVGPWTQEVLGKAMTPQEFLANPQAQNAVFEAKFGQYVTKYGSPQAASRAWFAGEGGMNNPNARDVNGMTPVRYEQQFNQNLPPEAQGAPPMQQPPPGVQPGGLQIDMPGPRPQAPQQSGAVGQPPPVTGQNVNGPAVMAAQMPPGVTPPAVPDVPKPAPDPQVVARAKGLVDAGKMTSAEAIREIEADIKQRWDIARERRTLEYKQKLGDYNETNKQQREIDTRAATELTTKRIDNFENKVRPAAVSAVNDINAIHQVRQVLDSGAFTGTGADAKTFLAKIGEQLGIPSEQAQNTQVLGAVLAKRVLAASGGTLGTGFSNADRDFVERASGGQIAMDEGAMRRLADIGERQARQTIKQYGEEAGRVQRMRGVSQAFDPEHFAIPNAPTYDEWSKANPIAPTQAAPVPGQMQPNGYATHPNPNAPTNMAPSGAPRGAVELLRSNPGLAADFDAKYGPGSAARVLGR